MDLSQGLMLFGVCLIPLYAWLQKFPEEQVQDINDVLQDFRTGEEPALLKWVEDNSLDVIKRHLEYFGKRLNTPNVAWQRLGLIADVKRSYLTLEFLQKH